MIGMFAIKRYVMGVEIEKWDGIIYETAD